MKKLRLLGVKISNLSVEELHEGIHSIISENRKSNVLNVNIHAMNIAWKTPWFKEMLNSAEINFCDGDGVRLGAWLQGKRIKEKITYNRWIWKLAEYAEKHGFTFYLLGSTERNISRAYQILQDKYPQLKILGYHHGYLENEENKNEVIHEIKRLKPNILCLGMGMPNQERFLLENYDNLNFNVSLTGGAVFDYVSGDFRMTPVIFYALKLEWFYRFIQQPKRLFVRYFYGNLIFLFRVIAHSVRNESEPKE